MGLRHVISVVRESSRLVAVGCVVVLASACSDGNLRGKSVESTDGKTYLVVDDDNGGGCGLIVVDGKQWHARIHEPSEISPGVHKISCGVNDDGVGFAVEAGTTFHFDYWGP